MKKFQIHHYTVFFTKKARAKNIRLRIDPAGNLLLTAPIFCRESQALSFVTENLDWIEKQMNRLLKPHYFIDGETILLLGKEYTIAHQPTFKGGVCVLGNQLIVGGEDSFLHRRITDYAKKILYVYIQNKTIEFAGLLNEKPHKITLRNTTSRWGSCSSQKNLNFCWKLAFAPQYVIDYIVAHEVSHLKEMNHGPAFWKTVASLNVAQADAQIWLRKHGKEIQQIV